MISRELTVAAPAKINLFLQVVGERPDGYHEINSLFQAIDLADTLKLSRIDKGVEFTCSDPSLPADESNLVIRAWELMRLRFDLPGGIKADLEKRIPIGAGLGGGSSDAAATLKAVNQLFELGLDRSRLSQLGSELGSDVPFFFSSGSALVEGRGELITDVKLPLDYHILLIIPDFQIRTKSAFAELRNFLTNYSTKSSLPIAISGADFYVTLNSLGNDFQALVCRWHPELETAIKAMRTAGASCVALSGSGSAIFALFSFVPAPGIRQEVAGRLNWQVFECVPVGLNG